MTREQVASVAIRNRPVKAFNKVTSYVNGLISTRLPEELEFVEEHIEMDSAYGMDYPNDGELLPIVCPRGYTGGKLENRAAKQDLDTSALDSGAYEFTIESTSNHNFQQRAHQFRDGFNISTQSFDGDLEFPVRVGPFQPYQSGKSVGNSIIPYVGEAMIEYHFRQYRSKDSNSDVYKNNGGGAYYADLVEGAARLDRRFARGPLPRPHPAGRLRGRLEEDRERQGAPPPADARDESQARPLRRDRADGR